MSEKKTSGQVLRQALEDSGWDRTDIADAAGVSRREVSLALMDREPLLRASAQKIARKLGIAVESLLESK